MNAVERAAGRPDGGVDGPAPTVHADRPVTLAERDGRAVVVKRYLRTDAGAVHDAMRALWASPFGAACAIAAPAMPEPLALEHGDTIVMAVVAGHPVGARGALGGSLLLAAPCARLLAQLHDSGVRVPRRRHAAALLRSLHRKAERLDAGGWSLATSWCDALDELARVAPSDEELVVSHGDFSPRNVLVDEHGAVSLIDFDRMQMASRSRDVEYWRAWCWATQLLAGEPPDWAITTPFVEAYRSASAASSADALAAGARFHRGAALLRIAEGWSALRAHPAVAGQVIDEARRTIATA